MMDVNLHEHFLICPYCWERISLLIDPSVNHQEYVEDCEVCCRPISVVVSAGDSEEPAVVVDRGA